VEKFGIKVTVVEPGYFRTDLLAPQSAVYGDISIDGYQDPAELKAQWSTYHGAQPGDPGKLAEALIQLAAMDSPPKQFCAGSDALASITTELNRRLAEMEAHKRLSTSTDGNF
jgi:NAD(P)-dependent dehydrogenase (short-subunit alcohol dehydrogenase family)